VLLDALATSFMLLNVADSANLYRGEPSGILTAASEESAAWHETASERGPRSWMRRRI
jgi:hypothetical protein